MDNQTDQLQLWLGRIGRALSIRIMFTALLVGLVAGVLAGMLWDPLTVPATLGVAALVWVAYAADDEQMPYCDACHKRVKLGASTCHHCGYSRTPPL